MHVPNGDFGCATVIVASPPDGAVPVEQRREVDVDELVAVQRVDVAVARPRARGELDPAAAAETLRLLRRDDLGAEPRELLLEERRPGRRRTTRSRG